MAGFAVLQRLPKDPCPISRACRVSHCRLGAGPAGQGRASITPIRDCASRSCRSGRCARLVSVRAEIPTEGLVHVVARFSLAEDGVLWLRLPVLPQPFSRPFPLEQALESLTLIVTGSGRLTAHRAG